MNKLSLIAIATAALGACAAPDSGSQVNGEAAFNQFCTKCHDNTLTGEGGGMATAPTVEALFLLPQARKESALKPGSAHKYADALPRAVRRALVEFLSPEI